MEHIADEILPPIKLLAKIIIRRKKRRRNSTKSFMRPNRRPWGEGLHWGVVVFISLMKIVMRLELLCCLQNITTTHIQERNTFFPRLSMRRENSENLNRIEIR
jgi:hypothetical protein